MTFVRSVDLSEFQGEVDGLALFDAGIGHAIVRCADPSRRGPVDPCYAANVAALTAAGVACDTYVFVRAYKGDPATEAHRYNEWARLAEVERLWLDVEWGSEGGMGSGDLGRWIANLIPRLEALGWAGRLGVYTNPNYWNSHVGIRADAVVARLPLWVSGYPFQSKTDVQRPPEPDGWEDWAFRADAPAPARGWTDWVGWQFSSVGDVVAGHDVDCNLFCEAFLSPVVTPADVPAPGPEVHEYSEDDVKTTLLGSGPANGFGVANPRWDPGFGRPPVFVAAAPNGLVNLDAPIGAHVEGNEVVLDILMVKTDGGVHDPFDVHVSAA